ncbi:MAG: copper chaperone PCu(A)C [Gemmatimonadota bacterium]
MRREVRHAPGASVTLLVLAALAACGEADRADVQVDGDPTDTTAAIVAESDGLAVVGPWVREAIMPEGSDAPDASPVNSAGYLVLRNDTSTDDALVAVEAAVSDTVELHTVSMDDGVMRMRPVDAVPVPAGGDAVLEPGGYHIMFIGLHGPLAEGDSVAMTLQLRSGRSIDLTAPVLRSPPGT